MGVMELFILLEGEKEGHPANQLTVLIFKGFLTVMLLEGSVVSIRKSGQKVLQTRLSFLNIGTMLWTKQEIEEEEDGGRIGIVTFDNDHNYFVYMYTNCCVYK